MIALIDGDILVYRIGFASQDVIVEFAYARMDKIIRDITAAVNAESYEVYITSAGHSNFRYTIYPEYKANRKSPKPTWYGELRAYLVGAHSAIVVEDREADDALADRQTDNTTVICSIDKDLDQVPGEHYDFVKDVQYQTTVESGTRFFYYQLLRGDPTDNIKGIEGIGPAKAAKILAGIGNSEQELFHRVRTAYEDHYKKKGDELMLMNGRLLKIGGPLWQFPDVGESEASKTNSNQISSAVSMPFSNDLNLDLSTNPAP